MTIAVSSGRATGVRRKVLPKSVQISIFRRDGWLCRWCRKPVVFAPTLQLHDGTNGSAASIGGGQ